jgi:hypothetical protein
VLQYEREICVFVTSHNRCVGKETTVLIVTHNRCVGKQTTVLIVSLRWQANDGADRF